LDELNGAATVTCSFVWGKQGEGFPNETSTTDLSSPDSFSKSISGLDPSTTYEFKAKGVSAHGTGYGSVQTFTTGAPSAPTMETYNASGVTMTEATLGGKVVDNGGATVTVWFEWGLDTNYGETTTPQAGFFTGDELYEPLTDADLDPDTTYHFRVVGQNSQGTSYGADKSFTTSAPTAPSVTTLDATDIGATAAMLHGQLTDDGGVGCDVRFTWSTNSTLSTNTTSSGWQTDVYTGDTFQYWATNMSIDTTYYFRAEARNAGGSINGTILSFTTIFAAPQNFAATPLTSTSIGLTWEPQSDKTLIIARTGTYPADRLDGKQVYFGSGSSTTYEGLQAGTTYFFRAWSWREGDNYSDAYAEDAATTTSGARPGEIETPAINETAPGAPSWWWSTPSSENIQKWPGVTLVDSIAAEMGMSVGTMWVIVAGVMAVLIGAAAATILPLSFAALGAGGFAIFVLSMVGVLAGWMLIVYVIIGGALLYLFRSGGP